MRRKINMTDSELVDWILSHRVQVGDCLEWDFTQTKAVAATRGGYPVIRYDGMARGIYRVLYFLSRGERVDNGSIVIRHKCDNVLCLNLDHLIPGSHVDNVMDRVSRERSASGSRNGRAKLNESQAAFIRNLCKAGEMTKTAIANMFGVSNKVVYNIAMGKQWGYTSPV